MSMFALFAGEELHNLPYSPADGWPQQGILPVTGGRILLHQQIGRTQEVRKKKIAGADENGRQEEQPEDLVNDEEMGEGDALRMDVLSQAVREFLVAVDDPQVGVTAPSKITIAHLLPQPRANVPHPTLRSGWAVRPAQGQTKGRTYFSGEFRQLAQQLFELGEASKGCKLSAHQMHAEMLRKFPARFDVPSISEIMAGISDLTLHRKNGTKPGNKGARRTEDRFPEQFGPLMEQWEQGQALDEKASVEWLTKKKPASGWPAGLNWPSRMQAHVRAALTRWKHAKGSTS